MEISSLNIDSASRQLAAEETTPGRLTRALLAVIEAKNPALNAFAATLKAEDIADQPYNSQLPLSGIPIAIKDLIDLSGWPTRAGSPKLFGNPAAAKDSAVTERLKAAGAIILGKTNTHEIALGITGINPHTGPVRNPQDPTRITGGSSSGSAAAVAAGMCLAALGSDTGGSIRIPAALCGVVGLKPTFGRVSTRGVLPLSWNLDHIGPLTKTVRDAALLLNVLAGYDSRDPASINRPPEDYCAGINGGVRGWRIALASGDYIDESDADVRETLATAAETLQALGATVTPMEIARLRECAAANGTMVIADAAAFHRDRLAQHPDWFGEDVRARLEKGRAVTSTEYALARRTQQEMKHYFSLFFEEYDLLLLPTTATHAAKIEGLDSAAFAPKMTRFTAPFNLTGLPALSLPFGKTSAGMPLGVQLVSEAWGESKVLRAAHALEQATTWTKKSFGAKSHR